MKSSACKTYDFILFLPSLHKNLRGWKCITRGKISVDLDLHLILNVTLIIIWSVLMFLPHLLYFFHSFRQESWHFSCLRDWDRKMREETKTRGGYRLRISVCIMISPFDGVLWSHLLLILCFWSRIMQELFHYFFDYIFYYLLCLIASLVCITDKENRLVKEGLDPKIRLRVWKYLLLLWAVFLRVFNFNHTVCSVSRIKLIMSDKHKSLLK